MAKPTAPPRTPTTSHPQVLDLGAKPVCRPGAPPVVPLAAPAPAVPLGVMMSPPVACTTVTAVMVDWLPSGRVVVCRTIAVEEGGLTTVTWLPPGDEAPEVAPAAGPERVMTPPSMVVTIVTPAEFVVVMTAPGVRDMAPPPLVLITVIPASLVVVTMAPEVRVTAPPLLVLITGTPASLVLETTAPEVSVTAPPPLVLTIGTPASLVLVTTGAGGGGTSLETSTGPGPRGIDELEPSSGLAGMVLVTSTVVGGTLPSSTEDCSGPGAGAGEDSGLEGEDSEGVIGRGLGVAGTLLTSLG